MTDLLLLTLLTVAQPPAVPHTTAFHLADLFGQAEAINKFAGIHTRTSTPVVDGRMYRAIDQHANVPGQGFSQVVYHLDLPALQAGERLVFRCLAVGNPKSPDGVDYVVKVDDQEIMREHHEGQGTKTWRVELDRFAGKSVTFVLLVDPLASNNYDNAAWVDPRIVIEGRAPTDKLASIPEYWSIPKLLERPAPDRIAATMVNDRAISVVTVMDEHLDLAVATSRQGQPRSAARRVPLGPRLVVGEGPHPDNHTLVKVLNEHQMTAVQFLAYPPEVRCGVQVEAGRDAAGQVRVVTAPFQADGVREIRVFDALGGLQQAFNIDSPMAAPFRIAVGDLLPDEPGDELAVLGFGPARARLVVTRLDGRELSDANLPLGFSPVTIATRPRDGGDELLLYDDDAARLQVVRPATSESTQVSGPGLADRDGAYAGPDGQLWAAARDPLRSELVEVGDDGAASQTLDVGRFENLFWVVTPPRDAKPSAAGLHRNNLGLAALDEGRYVKFCSYGHYRADAHSPGYKDPQFDNDDVAWWAGQVDTGWFRKQPCMWEPCFTHRGFPQLLGQWRAVVDPVSGAAQYMMSGRRNQADVYQEGQSDFDLTTYALDLPAIDHLYLDHLSLQLTALAEHCRRQPEANPSVEPNHEHEIPLNVDFTVGDYNPAMVTGFFDYLTRLYGHDLAGLNAALSTPFADWFDAPRWQDRGAWDDYGKQNPYFAAWLNYNRYVINRRLAQASREALLAGFPPEYLKYHQIPDTYIYGGDLGFSYVPNRITPLDFALSSGTGYGWTRYGVWYQREHNVCQGGWSSGHDNTIVGEYQALSKSDDDAAAQLRYMFDHGVMGIHAMGWDVERYQETMTEAVRRLIAEDRPRPGVAGGVGQVRAVTDGNRRYAVAAIGTGDGRTGLLKSLAADGSWEGSVYVTPFKAHVEVEAIADLETVSLPWTSPVLDGLDGGCQLELTATASGGVLVAEVLAGEQPLPGLTVRLPLSPTSRTVRWTHRVQLPADGVRLRLRAETAAAVRALRLFRETARIAHLHRGIMAGQRHRGGVSFAVLP